MADGNDNAGGERLQVAYLVAEARREFFNLDSGFLHTAKRFVLHPGATMAAVWRGEKQGLTSPVRYFLIVYTLYALAFISTGAMEIYWQDVQRQMSDAHAAMGSKAPVLDPGPVYLQHPFVSELGIALMLFAATWPWFNSARINVAERAALPLYWYGTINLVQIPFFPVILLGYVSQYTLAITVLSFVYIGWAGYEQVDSQRFKSAGRALGWWISAIILWPALIAAVVGITMAIQNGMAARGGG